MVEINKIYWGDNKKILKEFSENYFDSIVTDSPYGLKFMNKHWDYDVPTVEFWKECIRVLKPGGYVLSFGGSRTYHRMACNIEDAGFEIRDQIMWVYGSGFPKSHNIGKAIDKLQGNEREIINKNPNDRMKRENQMSDFGLCGGIGKSFTSIGTSEFEGCGTALKPAHEPIVLAMKPLSEKTFAENVLKWGTGGINIDGCRVEGAKGDGVWGTSNKNVNPERTFVGSPDAADYRSEQNSLGRFPANFIYDGSDEVLSLFPNTKSGKVKSKKSAYNGESLTGFLRGDSNENNQHGDSGSASRFFYCAKASKTERNMGCEELEEKRPDIRTEIGMGTFVEKGVAKQHNFHPTVKPIKLMQYLVRLVTPKNGIVLDPFAGSGSTGIACVLEGFNYVLIEKEKEYCEIAEKRLELKKTG